MENSARETAQVSRFFSKRWQRVMLILVALYLFYLLFFWLAFPPLLKWQLQTRLAEQLGREVSLEQASFNPFTLALSLERFDVLPATTDGEFSGFERVLIDVRFWPLFRGHLSFDAVEIAGLYLVAERDEQGRFSFDDIVERLQQAPTTETEAQPAEEADTLIALAVERFELADGRLQFSDRLHGHDALVQVSPLNFKLNQFSTITREGDVNRYAIRAILPSGGDLIWEGKFDLSPGLRAAGTLEMTELRLHRIMPFLLPYVNFRLPSAELDVKTDYQIEENKAGWQIATSAGRAILRDLSLGPKNAEALPLQIGQLGVQQIAVTYPEQQIAIGNVQLSNSSVQMALDESGQLDLVRLFTPATEPETVIDEGGDASAGEGESPADAPAARPWLWSLDGSQLSNIEIALTEQISGQPLTHKVALESIAISRIDSAFSQPFDTSLKAVVNNSSRLELDASSMVSLAEALSVESKIQLALNGLELPFYQAHLSPYLNLELTSGTLSTRGDISFALQHNQVQLDTQLALEVNDFVTRTANQDLVTWQKLAVSELQLDLADRKLALKQVDLDQPFARVIVAEDGSTNIGDLLVTGPDESASVAVEKAEQQRGSAEDPAQQEWGIRVERVAIEDGQAFFADRSITPDFATGIYQLSGELSTLDSDVAEPAKIDLEGQVDKYAPMTVSGALHPLRAAPYLDLVMAFNNIELTSFTPYSGTYAGYVIDKGQLNLDLNYQLDDNRLKGSNRVVIDQLQLGKRTQSDKATTLPVALAVGLLKDGDGVIDLGLEVAGNVDEPEFSLGGLIAQAFTKVITKLITSPFALLSSLVGGDEALDTIAFSSGSAELQADNRDKLDKLASALEQRPQLNLEISGRVDPAQEKAPLQQQALSARAAESVGEQLTEFTPNSIAANPRQRRVLEQLAAELPRTWRNEQVARIKQQLSESDNSSPEALDRELVSAYYRALLEQQPIPDSQFAQLAQMRAQAVKAYLVDNGKVDPARIFILKTHLDREPPSLVTQLSLKAE